MTATCGRAADRCQRLHQLQFTASLAPLRILIERPRVHPHRTRLANLDRGRARAVELALQRLRGVDVDFALGAGGAIGQELESVLADFNGVAALQQMLLIGWPLTVVPLVEPRSSRYTSPPSYR